MEWLFSCNLSRYDIDESFKNFNKINWRQKGICCSVGDTVYMYLCAPQKRIGYKCQVTKMDLEAVEIDDSEFILKETENEYYGKFLEITLVEKYDEEALKLQYLKENGLITVRWAARMPEELSNYIASIVGTDDNELKEILKYKPVKKQLEYPKQVDITQKERDSKYPRDYVTEIPISVKQWKSLLKNSDIFTYDDITLLKRFYLSDNHACSCYDLANQDNKSPSSYISPIVNLARRISDQMGLPPIYGTDGKQTWWRIPFWGTYRDDGHFEWKVRPQLAEALESLFPEIKQIQFTEKEDVDFINTLRNQVLPDETETFEYNCVPKEKKNYTYTNNHKTFSRDITVAVNALSHAKYKCEIDKNHSTFIRRKDNKPYTEPHHLIPLCFSDSFSVSLDVEENVVSLCGNCHNEIHYGKDAEKLIRKLYKERKDLLDQVGLEITLDMLLEMYGIYK